ncbi:cilia- and flagella-associated protein 54-like isoform X1 [Octopus bimaculoides]|uniref:cilia- and flagella-associated protein 54-like isoform X1 n=2 Tax=Octopus bimaculoides TaxID=37653 RepID=UPI0022E1C312|nr:cilia- and flagella-associated protein 54-like isoform X1 [Octopus bimaculoides]
MATNIRLKAAKLLNRQYPSSFYDAVGCKINPVFTAFKKEKEDFFFIFRTKTTDVPSVYGRPSMTLFEMLKKYQPLLPQEYFLKQLLKIGNFLRDEEEYILALSCYNFYFLESDINKCIVHYDLERYKKCFFPEGLQSNTALLTIQILIANYFCKYQIEKMNTQQCCQSAEESEKILLSYQMLTQVLLPESSYCWLLYNCIVLMYTICQDMIMAGHSAKVVQYLIWVCLCMENSPLLCDISYLSWRSTTYTAVCQCYYECKAGEHAEAFARRALCKINDLWHVEKKNDKLKYNHHTAIIRECTLKVFLMFLLFIFSH